MNTTQQLAAFTDCGSGPGPPELLASGEFRGTGEVDSLNTPFDVGLSTSALDVLDERLHLVDLLALRLDDPVGQGADPWIRNVRPLTGKNSN